MIRIGWFIPLTVALMLPACGSAHHDYDDPVEWDGDSDESTDEPAFLEGLLEASPAGSSDETYSETDPSESPGIIRHGDSTTPRAADSWYSLDPGIPADGGNPQPWSMDNATR